MARLPSKLSNPHRYRCSQCNSGRIWVVTGTDTGVGKTVLAALLTVALRQAQVDVAALKPICTGGRDDARLLHAAAGGRLELDEVNPWSYSQPLAPVLAARRDHRRLTLRRVVGFVQSAAARADIVVMEGAGGLLSPLGVDFDTRDLIRRFHAVPWVVCPNRLGAVNQALLVADALGAPARTVAGTIVLMDQPEPDASAPENARLIREGLRRVGTVRMQPPGAPKPDPCAAGTPRVGPWRVVEIPRLKSGWRQQVRRGAVPVEAKAAVARLLREMSLTRMASLAGRSRIP